MERCFHWKDKDLVYQLISTQPNSNPQCQGQTSSELRLWFNAIAELLFVCDHVSCMRMELSTILLSLYWGSFSCYVRTWADIMRLYYVGVVCAEFAVYLHACSRCGMMLFILRIITLNRISSCLRTGASSNLK